MGVRSQAGTGFSGDPLLSLVLASVIMAAGLPFTSLNADGVGEVHLTILNPDGDSTPLQWTPSGCANHFECVDEARDHDGDGSFVTDTPPGTETFTLGDGDIPLTATIDEIRITVMARSSAGGSAGVGLGVINLRDDSLCAEVMLISGSSYQEYTAHCTQIAFGAGDIPDLRLQFANAILENSQVWVSSTFAELLWRETSVVDDPDDLPPPGKIRASCARPVWPWLRIQCVAKENLGNGSVARRLWYIDTGTAPVIDQYVGGANIPPPKLDTGSPRYWWFIPADAVHNIGYRVVLTSGLIINAPDVIWHIDYTWLWAVYISVFVMSVVSWLSHQEAPFRRRRTPRIDEGLTG